MIPLSIILALAGPPNVVLVTIDGLRADYLHAYGRSHIETPATDRLAREGVLVEDATVQVPQTRPSHASLMSNPSTRSRARPRLGSHPARSAGSSRRRRASWS